MTPQLDPAAVEAAAKVYWINATGRNDTRGSMAWSEQSDVLQATIRDTITSNITAFIAAIEPQLRERMATLSITAMDNGIVLQNLLHQTPEDQKEHVVFTPELSAAINNKYSAHEAILALFGLEAE